MLTTNPLKTFLLSCWTKTRTNKLAIAALVLAVGFNLFFLAPEIDGRVPMMNDEVLHQQGIQRVLDALNAGQNPTDVWLGNLTLGFPLFHHYQHLAYTVGALLYWPLQHSMALADFMNGSRYLLLSLFPLSLFLAMRKLGFNTLTAALAGALGSLLSTNGLYGFDYGSYVWAGYGLYTQLWGMLLMPLAVACGVSVLRTGRGYALAAALLAATLLTHTVLGYIALASLVALGVVQSLFNVFAPTNPPSTPDASELRPRFWPLVRLVGVLALVAIAASYFLLPFAQDGAYMNRSVWELQSKYDAYGAEWTLSTLTDGGLFDFGRFPTLTLLAITGFGIGLWRAVRQRDRRYIAPVGLFALWLLLYFGRPTWGALLDVLPMSRDLHFHRLIAGVHLGGIFLVGIGAAELVQWAAQWAAQIGSLRVRLLAGLVALIALAPVLNERAAYYIRNRDIRANSQRAYNAEAKDIESLIAYVRGLPPGRIYAGLAGKWGRDYTVGEVPMYALLSNSGLDTVGFLYHALALTADVQVEFNDALAEQYNLFNIRYVVVPTDWTVPAYYRALHDFGRHRLYQIQTSGYFDVVNANATLVGQKSELYPAASAWLSSNLVAAKQHPVLKLGAASEDAAQSLAQSASRIAQQPISNTVGNGLISSEAAHNGAYAAMVNLEHAGMVMLKSTYHPGWQAMVDGAAVPTQMLMPGFVGVEVPAGRHQVSVTYQVSPLRGWMMLLGLVALGFAAWLDRRTLAWQRARRGPVAWPHGMPPAFGAGSLLARLAARYTAATEAHAWVGHVPYLLVLVVAVLMAGAPLLRLQAFSGHDALEYLPRNVEFYNGLLAGQWLPRWAPDLSGGHGQPLFNFNPPVIYYLTAFFHAWGSSFSAAESLACLVLMLCAAVGNYGLGQSLYGKRAGVVAGVGYIFAPYFLSVLYVRHALADYAIFAFIPFAFWGVLRYVQRARGRDLLCGVLAVALMVLSSNPVALVTMPLLIGLVLWVALAAARHDRAAFIRMLVRGGWCLAAGMGLAAFFWIPALAEREYVHLERLLQGYLNYGNHFVFLSQLLYSPWGYGLSMPGTADGMSYAIGPVHLILLAVVIGLVWHLRGWGEGSRMAKSIAVFVLLSFGYAAFLSLDVSQFVWDRVSLLQYLEFAWRLHSLVAFSTALLCGAAVYLIGLWRPALANRAWVVVLAGLVIFNLGKAKPEQYPAINEADYSPKNIASGYINVNTANEYDPVWVQERPPEALTTPLVFVQGSGQIINGARTSLSRDYTVEVDAGGVAQLRENTFYFPGWRLWVDGVVQTVQVDNPNGLMDFHLPPGRHTLRFEFVDTPVRTWSERLSVAVALLLIGQMAWAYWRRTSLRIVVSPDPNAQLT